MGHASKHDHGLVETARQSYDFRTRSEQSMRVRRESLQSAVLGLPETTGSDKITSVIAIWSKPVTVRHLNFTHDNRRLNHVEAYGIES
jgi:hypothetical protein